VMKSRDEEENRRGGKLDAPRFCKLVRPFDDDGNYDGGDEKGGRERGRDGRRGHGGKIHARRRSERPCDRIQLYGKLKMRSLPNFGRLGKGGTSGTERSTLTQELDVKPFCVSWHLRPRDPLDEAECANGSDDWARRVASADPTRCRAPERS
jgi:hypothetical protein